MRRAVLAAALALPACNRRAPAPADQPSLPPAARSSSHGTPPPAPDACTGVGNPSGVRLPPGFCLRPVATGLQRPRQMAVGPAGEILVAESGSGWRPNRGRVSVLRPQPDGTFTRDTLLTPMDRPHGIALRDGAVWVAEASRIVRAPYPATGPVTPTAVLSGLPAEGRHPHKTLAFGPDGWLYFSVGSATDNCVATPGSPAPDPCPESLHDDPTVERAVVRRLQPATGRTEVFAHGLRNTLGLAWHPASGRLYGVDNGRDAIQHADPALSDALLPHDELNELTPHADYGWPYCYDASVPSPEYVARGTCAHGSRAPALLLPPHAAPLGIVFYDGTMFPPPWRGRALVTYHGYRAAGHRLVGIPFTADGHPAGEPEDLVSGWEERPGRPHGHLTGLAVGADGRVFISDDVGGTVYALAWGASALAAAPPPPPPPPENPAVVETRCADLARRTDLMATVQRTVIDARCVVCHGAAAGGLTLRQCDWRGSWESLVHGRSAAYGAYVVPGAVDQGVLMARLHGDTMGPRMPFQGVPLAPDELSTVEAWVRAGAPAP